MRNFPLIFNSELNCISSPIISFMAWKGLEYRLAFSYIWGFSFNDEDQAYPGALGPRIEEGFNNIFECLSYFYNVEINRHYDIGTEEIYQLVKEETSKGMPVIIFTDMYNCVWTNLFKKVHLNHSCTVVDLDKERNLFCIDSAPPCDGAIMKIEDFHESCTGCLTINLDKYKDSEIDWRVILHNAVNRANKNEAFSSLDRFVNSFKSSFDLEAELKTAHGNDPHNAHIIWRLLRISGGRTLFSIFLEYLGEKYNNIELLNFSKEFKSISDKWKINHALVLRYMKNPENKDILNRISNNFSIISESEAKMADKLLKL
ncbi:BtrH N-terminal domain-containing protein [Ruminiclostridium josui]|uniref:BtrH N-terminal domain-containing protein n=1 Tax=Ruminiclostridium josui TaxID=1499 RepID=UPI00046787C0|nr:BtrH N-terminal domain-containing protein [Ruminiclostridium josui]